ncbi:hypothetical protein AB3N59_07745 [Leptospira sp. WS92.C1]
MNTGLSDSTSFKLLTTGLSPKNLQQIRSQFLVTIGLLFLFSNCIAMRVYVANPGLGDLPNSSIATPPKTIENYQIETPKYFSEQPFAQHSPSLFYFVPKSLTNQYGTVAEIIKQELMSNPDFQPETNQYLVRIIDFNLYSKDKCFSNETGINFEIEVENILTKKKILEFKYKDLIKSYVTDCYAAVASAPFFLGWILYAPYIGFRGDREDQLNQIGRIAILEFFDSFKKSRKTDLETNLKQKPFLKGKKNYEK